MYDDILHRVALHQSIVPSLWYPLLYSAIFSVLFGVSRPFFELTSLCFRFSHVTLYLMWFVTVCIMGQTNISWYIVITNMSWFLPTNATIITTFSPLLAFTLLHVLFHLFPNHAEYATTAMWIIQLNAPQVEPLVVYPSRTALWDRIYFQRKRRLNIQTQFKVVIVSAMCANRIKNPSGR